MNRTRGTDRQGKPFPAMIIHSVWNKGEIVPGVDPAIRRRDECGAWIECDRYGETNENGTGWEIDHIVPVALGGVDDLSNLQPLQWQNNRQKGDDWPNWQSAVAAGSGSSAQCRSS